MDKKQTVSEIASELGVSVQSIYKFMTDDFKRKYVSVEKPFKIDLNGVNLIHQHFKREKPNDIAVSALERENYGLKQDKIDLQRQISELHQLLSQAQQLSLKQSEKIDLLETEISSTNKQPEKRSIWSRIFKS